MFEQLGTKKIPGFCPSPLGEKIRAEQVNATPYVSMTEIAEEKKSSSPSYLVQSWMRSNTTIESLRIREKSYNPRLQEDACNELIHTIKTTSATPTPSLWISSPGDGDADEPRQRGRNDSTSENCSNLPGVVVSGVYAGIGEKRSDVSAS